jgi:hypothetical protein
MFSTYIFWISYVMWIIIFTFIAVTSFSFSWTNITSHLPQPFVVILWQIINLFLLFVYTWRIQYAQLQF